MIKLETDRIIIKPHSSANAEKLMEWDNDKDLLYYNDNQPLDRRKTTLEEIYSFINENALEKAYPKLIHYAIHKKSDFEFIGYGMIAFIDYYNRQCKLGIVIGNKEEWGKGFAKEVLNEVINYCFSSLKMNRIGAEIYSINERSIQLFEHLGFKREGILKQSILKDGKFADEYIYGLLRSEWKKK